MIKRYEARLEAPLPGMGVVAFVHVTMGRGSIRSMARFRELIVECAQIQACFSVIGGIDYVVKDYVVKVVARDLKKGVAGVCTRYTADPGRKRRMLGRDQVHARIAARAMSVARHHGRGSLI